MTVSGASESLASSARERGITVIKKGSELSLEFRASTEEEAINRLNVLSDLVRNG